MYRYLVGLRTLVLRYLMVRWHYKSISRSGSSFPALGACSSPEHQEKSHKHYEGVYLVYKKQRVTDERCLLQDKA